MVDSPSKRGILRGMKKILISVCIFIAIATVAYSDAAPDGNVVFESFSKVKKLLLLNIYPDHRLTFYCGCVFDETKRVDFDSCGYVPRKNRKRARRIEWDHVVPAEAFGHSFREWREGDPVCVDNRGFHFKGRKCAEKASRDFRLMQCDMYNLVPVIGEVNGDRKNFSMALIPGEERRYGACDVEIKDRKFEPPPAVRGDIARIYMYMEETYPGHGVISGKNRKLYDAWDREDPVDAWECERAERIRKLQGNVNLVLQARCAANQ